MQHRHQNRWAGFSLSCAHYAESMVLLDLSSARRKQRDDPVTAKELAGLRGLLGQLMWLNSGDTTTSSSFVAAPGISGSGHWFNTPGSKQTCKTCIGFSLKLFFAHFVHEEMSVIGWSDASWARRIVSRRIHHWSGQQDILGTSGKSYQCD